MKLHPFVEAVAKLRLENCFNPYADRCVEHDQYDAPQRRSATLSTILDRATEKPVEALWIGRDLGHRGGRRTGLALTDDVYIGQHLRRWNIDLAPERPTKGNAITEHTATVIWDMLVRIDARIFLWNVFPLHPYQAGCHFTNRSHNTQERRVGEKFLCQIIDILQPSRIIAIGKDAANAANHVVKTVPIIPVRHPSYGGKTQFQKEISEIYKVRKIKSLSRKPPPL